MTQYNWTVKQPVAKCMFQILITLNWNYKTLTMQCTWFVRNQTEYLDLKRNFSHLFSFSPSSSLPCLPSVSAFCFFCCFVFCRPVTSLQVNLLGIWNAHAHLSISKVDSRSSLLLLHAHAHLMIRWHGSSKRRVLIFNILFLTSTWEGFDSFLTPWWYVEDGSQRGSGRLR